MRETLIDALKSLTGPVSALVVGGTSGIGAGIAIALSQHQDDDSVVYIAGRRQDAAEAVIQRAKDLSPKRSKQAILYRKLDASLMKNIAEFCLQLKKDLGGSVITYLVLSQGVITLTRKDTSEGIAEIIALNYYGRMFFIRRLRELEVLAPDCIVLSILNARAGDPSGQKINFDDLDLRSSGLIAGIQQNFAMSDIMIQDFGVTQDASGPRMTFIHDYPGFVKTDLVKNAVLKGIFAISEFFLRRTISPEEAGEIIVAGSVDFYLKTRQGEKGYWYMDELGAEIVKVVTEPSIRVKIREHTWSIVDMALKDGVRHVVGPREGG